MWLVLLASHDQHLDLDRQLRVDAGRLPTIAPAEIELK
jgi:hypothetical protein